MFDQTLDAGVAVHSVGGDRCSTTEKIFGPQ